MKTLVKEWSFWTIIAIYAAALTVAAIQVNAVACIWVFAAAFWQIRYMLKEVFAHELIRKNNELTIKLCHAELLIYIAELKNKKDEQK